ncbi:MAG: HAD-IIB family hydrolase [Streptococcus suis]
MKAVFFDIDGTLLTDHRTVSKSTILAINQLKARGILVGLATGRDPRFILQYMASLGLDMAVAYNGQYVFTRDEVVFSQPIEKEDIDKMIAYAEKFQRDLSFGTALGVVGSGIMSMGTGNFAYRFSRMVPVVCAGFVNFIFNHIIRIVRPQNKGSFNHLITQPIYQMMLLTMEKEAQRLAEYFPQLTFTRSSPYATDIICKGNSKLIGIKRLGDFYYFSTDEVMVFGDSNNDIEMLGEVRYSVAMKNGTKQAKQVASYITDTNNKDGIYKGLRHFNLVEEQNV